MKIWALIQRYYNANVRWDWDDTNRLGKLAHKSQLNSSHAPDSRCIHSDQRKPHWGIYSHKSVRIYGKYEDVVDNLDSKRWYDSAKGLTEIHSKTHSECLTITTNTINNLTGQIFESQVKFKTHTIPTYIHSMVFCQRCCPMNSKKNSNQHSNLSKHSESNSNLKGKLTELLFGKCLMPVEQAYDSQNPDKLPAHWRKANERRLDDLCAEQMLHLAPLIDQPWIVQWQQMLARKTTENSRCVGPFHF